MLSTHLILQQQVKLTQRQVLAMRVLALPTQNLHEFIQEKIIENPLLEMEPVSYKTGKEKESAALWEKIPDRDLSFEEALLRELRCYQCTPAVREGVRRIVCSLDQHGFFTGDLKALGEAGHISYEDMRQALALIQECDPPGVGAASVQESLLLQIKHSEKIPPFGTEAVLREHFTDFLQGRWDTITAKTGVSMRQLRDIRLFLKPFQPYPARQYTQRAAYIRPEVEVQAGENGTFSLRFLEELPPLTFRKDLYDLYYRAGDKETRCFLAKYRQGFLLLQEALAYRRASIIRVMQYILQVQQQFFTRGMAIKPLLQKDIAAVTSLSASTVSRVCRARYMLFQGNVYAFQEFFGRAYACCEENEERVSDKFVMKELQTLIAGEDKLRPLSDQALCDVLGEQHITISRRTVTKFRLKLNIPNSSIRRRRYML